MPDRSRIPPKPADYYAFMLRTDARQLSIDTATGNPRWMQWKWTAAESEQWTKFRKRCDELYVHYSNKKFKTTNVKDEIHLLIRQTKSYDSSRLKGHRLLGKIQLYGNLQDWLTFNIKQGTVLQKKPVRGKEEMGDERPVIMVRDIGVLSHLLSVRNMRNTRKRTKPDGVIFTDMFRYIGTRPPQGIKGFEHIGVAKRGMFTSRLDGIRFNRNKKYYAWYLARYRSRKGKVGKPSEAVRVMIIDY